MLVLDIETVPTDFAEANALQFSKKNWGDDLTAEEKTGYLGLHPASGRVACISVLMSEVNEVLSFGPDLDERKILSEFWAFLPEYISNSGNTFLRLCTYNGKGFDCPFLLVRSGIVDVKPSMALPLRKWYTDYHVDLYELLRDFGGSLDYWMLGIFQEHKTLHDITIKAAWDKRDFDMIRQRCEGDVRATYAVFNRVSYLLD